MHFFTITQIINIKIQRASELDLSKLNVYIVKPYIGGAKIFFSA